MKFQIIFFSVACIVLFTIFVFDVKESKESRQGFASQWSTMMVGRVVKTNPVASDAGIIFLRLDTISRKKHDVANYTGGPFYLLTSGKRAKLFEGGMSEIKNEDVVVLNSDGSLLVSRNGVVVIQREIAFRDFKPLWERVDENSIKSNWSW